VPSDGDEPSYEWLDEWLCEYVDGTMDPSLEAVFEQYVEANPELKAHVQRLKETRDLLCSCGLSSEPPPDVEATVCREVECDMRPSSDSEEESARTPSIPRVGLVASVAAALVIGFLMGAVVVRPVPSAMTSDEPSAAPVAGEVDPAPSSQRDGQAVERERPDPLRRPAAMPFSAVDTTQPSASITTIGAP